MNVQRGFTLIELLVVVAIIGLLASVVLASLNEARGRAEDVRRYADMNQIKTALTMYYSDNRSYPDTGGRWFTVCTNGADPVARTTSGPDGYIPNLAPEYISQLPTDPSGCTGGGFKGYLYASDGQDYKFLADGTAFAGTECEVGRRFDDPGQGGARDERWCAVYTEGFRDR